MHYQRWSRHGDPLKRGSARRYARGETCSIERCEEPLKARGWCSMHYSRWRQHGDPLFLAPRRRDDAGYAAAHDRVKQDRGRAADHSCVQCGKQARDWAYDGKDPDERQGEGRRNAYSLDPAHYQPFCRSCHMKHDGVAPRKTRNWVNIEQQFDSL